MKQLDILRGYDIPLGSASEAIQMINRKQRLTRDEYLRRITELAPEAVEILGEHVDLEDSQMRFMYLYLVQQIIEDSENTDVLDMEETAVHAFERATGFMRNNSWIFAEKAEKVKLDAAGNVKPKKGAKKDLAKQVYNALIKGKDLTRKAAIDVLVKEVGLTPAGASTYYANLKKGKY